MISVGFDRVVLGLFASLASLYDFCRVYLGVWLGENGYFGRASCELFFFTC